MNWLPRERNLHHSRGSVRLILNLLFPLSAILQRWKRCYGGRTARCKACKAAVFTSILAPYLRLLRERWPQRAGNEGCGFLTLRSQGAIGELKRANWFSWWAVMLRRSPKLSRCYAC